MSSLSPRDYRLISCNDHIVLPPNAFDEHLSTADRERVKVELFDGPARTIDNEYLRQDYIARGRGDETVRGHVWNYDGVRFFTSKISTIEDTSKLAFDDVTPPFDYDAIPERLYDPVARLEVLDRDQVITSATYPMIQFPGFGGAMLLSTLDRDFALRVVRAYNDWILDEFVSRAPGRYLGLVVLPLWDPAACAREIARTAAKGARGLIFVEDPFRLDLPSLYDRSWDVVFAAAQDADLPLCIHQGSSILAAEGPPNRTRMSMLNLTCPTYPLIALADFVGSLAFVRFPRLRIVLNESEIGWVPHALGRFDFMWRRHGMSGGPGYVGPSTPELPSTYIPGHVWFSLNPSYETFGPQVIRDVGIDNVVVDVDYPHADTSYGETTQLLHKRLGYLDDDELQKVLRGNAQHLFNIS